MRRTGMSGLTVRIVVLALVVSVQGCTLPLIPVAAVYRQFLPECGPTAPKGQACKTPWDWKRAIFGAWTRADSLNEER